MITDNRMGDFEYDDTVTGSDLLILHTHTHACREVMDVYM